MDLNRVVKEELLPLPTSADTDNHEQDTDEQQKSAFKYCFGQLQHNRLWEEGSSPFDKARPKVLRSIQEECCSNDGGIWRLEYNYVAKHKATQGRWKFAPDGTHMAEEKPDWPKTRDLGHTGRTLDWFCGKPEAVRANLTRAEVAMLRLYTGPMFRALNGALRGLGGGEALSNWWTCIAVLTCACFKLSFLPGAANDNSDIMEVFRGLEAKDLKDCTAAGEDPKKTLDVENKGGVELAFCSTTVKCNVAQLFAKGGIVLCFELTSTTRAASVEWLSQYPEESEWLLPPSTVLKPKTSIESTEDKKALDGAESTAVRKVHFVAVCRA